MLGGKAKIIFLVVPLIIVFVAIGLVGLYSSNYLTVSDLRSFNEPVKVTVMGNVTKGSVRMLSDAVTFVITDGDYSVKVYYPSIVQLDNSTNFAQVTVEGIYYPDQNLINATNVLFKCPSKTQIEMYNQTSSE